MNLIYGIFFIKHINKNIHIPTKYHEHWQKNKGVMACQNLFLQMFMIFCRYMHILINVFYKEDSIFNISVIIILNPVKIPYLRLIYNCIKSSVTNINNCN